jgi:endonuclease/exonuclease/phosphatase family metal-dependent hydrolase
MTICRAITYNIHRCFGSDYRYAPGRIVELIRLIQPDIVALQEVDEGAVRSRGDRQAALIAGELGMEYRFLPTLEIKGGHYGLALLSRHPMLVVKEEILTEEDRRRGREPRGAIWSAISIGKITVQVFALHLGLSRWERDRQADAVLGSGWLLHPACTGPVILMGDLNTGPRSAVYRRISRHLTDAQKSAGRREPAKTWPSRFPLFRLDHIFVSSTISVPRVEVPRAPGYREASDHLPVIADMEIAEDESFHSRAG